MAFINQTITYSGKNAEGFYSRALLSATTIGHLKIVPNVKNKINMASLNMSGIVGARNCAFTPAGDVTLGQKQLSVADLGVAVEICQKDIEATYLSEQLRPGANKLDIAIEDFVADYIADFVAADLEDRIWNAPSSYHFTGFLAQMTADNATLKVTAGTVTAANVIAELQKVYDLIPAAVLSRKKVKIFVSYNVAKAYRQAIAQKSNEAHFVGEKELNFLGLELVETGMVANRMVAAEGSNLWIGTDLVSDLEDVSILPQTATGDDTVRFKANFKFGVAYGNSTEVVLYA
jgi:hypothetical protein